MAKRLLSSWGWLIVVALLTVVSQLATFYLIPDGQFNDDAAYALRALKLVDPVGQQDAVDVSDLRPGWPLMLAAPLAVAGQDLRAGRVLTTLFTACNAALLAFLLYRRSGSRLLACGIALLFTQASRTLQLGSSLMSEPFYYFLTLLLFASTQRTWRWPVYWVLGILAGWCTVVRSDGVTVALSVFLCMLVDREKPKKLVGVWVFGVLAFRLLLKVMIPDGEVHFRQLSMWASGEGYSLSYLGQYFKLNSLNSLASITGSYHPAQSWFWAVLALILGWLAFSYRGRMEWRALGRDPMVWWVVLYPSVLFLWPYFNSRYWVLWTVVMVGLLVSKLPPKVAWVLPLAMLCFQFPQTVQEYRNGPVAHHFQTKVYLPFYRAFSDHGTVMTLNYARVELLSTASTKEPMERTEFISLPFGMAGMGVEYVEWEQGNRHIRTLYGQEVRAFPPLAWFWLEASTLYEVHHDCGFSTCFRLKADPRYLVEAARLVATARAEQDPARKLALYNQALDLVPDLPEARIERALHQLALEPEASAPVEELVAVYKQYPHNYQHGENLLELLRFRGDKARLDEVVELALKTVERVGGTPKERFEKFRN